jgi:AcrR family transcriptional regulator
MEGEMVEATRTTRDRVLDVALDLFIEQGYDKTSMREVAERMGFSKAALYYHFPSKSEMLVSLHKRMHALMDEPLALLGEGTPDMATYEDFLACFLGRLLENEKLFVLHRVNQAAMAKLHIEGHERSHEDLEERAKKLFSDESLSEVDRVRMAAAFAAAFMTPVIVGSWLPQGSTAALARELREVVHHILRPAGAQ